MARRRGVYTSGNERNANSYGTGFERLSAACVSSCRWRAHDRKSEEAEKVSFSGEPHGLHPVLG